MTAALNTFTPQDLSRIQRDTFVASVEFHERLASTNDQGLLRAAQDDMRTPMLILAQEQTQGRGRSGNQWLTRPGALTFSLVVDCQHMGLTANHGMAISLVTAIAVRDALAFIHPAGDFRLKWPNDVYLGSRKLAGILLERTARRPSRLVVGIGINVNNPMSGAADDFRLGATSLCDDTSRCFSLADTLQTVLIHLEKWYTSFAAADNAWVAHWRRHCLLHRKQVSVLAGGRQITGLCDSIDQQGALQIQNDTGTHALISGTVERFDAPSEGPV